MSFKRLNQKRFHGEHDRDEGESISQDARNVEQLECDPDLEADAVGPAEEFDDEYNLLTRLCLRPTRRVYCLSHSGGLGSFCNA